MTSTRRPAASVVLLLSLFAAIVHGDGDSGPLPPNLEHINTNCVIVIISLLVVITVFFEYSKDKIEESAEGPMEPILESLFSEMTILGFVGLLAFVVSRLNVLTDLSIKVLGEEYADKLSTDLEDVHMLLFFVMIVFLCEALLLVRFGKIIEKSWRKYEEMAVQEEARVLESDSSPSFFTLTLFKDPTKDLYEARAYCLIRRDFLHVETGGLKVSPDFDFGEYLVTLLGEQLGNVVSIKWTMWLCLEIVFVGFYLLFQYTDFIVQMISFGIFGWCLFLLALATTYHMRYIKFMVTPRGIIHGPSSANLLPKGSAATASSPSLNVPAGGPSLPRVSSASSLLPKYPSVNGSPSESSPLVEQIHPSGHPLAVLPPYHAMEVKRPSPIMIFLGGGVPNKQESLFWFKKRGPGLLFFIIQASLLLTAVYLAAFVFYFLPKSYAAVSHGVFAVYVIICLIPPFLFFFEMIPWMISRRTEICSVGLMRKREHARKVERLIRTRRSLRALKLLQMVSWKAKRSGGAAGGEGEGSSGEAKKFTLDPRAPELSQLEKKEMQHIFNIFDADHSNSISSKELNSILESLGQTIDPVDLNQMVAAIDVDGNGSIDFEEFCLLVRTMKFVNQMDPEEQIQALFNIFDKDGSGSVTAEEFAQVILSLGQELSATDVEELIREIDEDGNGQIELEEFANMMRRHAEAE